MFDVIFSFALLVLVQGQTTQIERCGARFGDPPINTFVQGCITMPCDVVQGEDATIHVVFEAPHTIRSMETIARVSMGFNFNYTLEGNAVTCNHLQNTYCPLQKGEIVEYTLRMFIQPVFPTISVPIEFMVEDSNRIVLWCSRIRIQVVSPQQEGISDNSDKPTSNRFILKYHNSTKID